MSNLSSEEINQCMRKLNVTNFIGVYSLDKIPPYRRNGQSYGLVLNTDVFGHPGKHWLAIYVCPPYVEVFDSFAQPLPSILKRWLINNFPNRWTTNKLVYQDPSSDFCGAYALWYIYKRFALPSMYNVLHLLSVNNLSQNDKKMRRFYNQFCS